MIYLNHIQIWLSFNPLIDYLGNDEDIVYEENFSCPQLYQRLVIGSNGKALLCANDEEGGYIIGDANIESIYGIWHGERMERARQLHRDGAFKKHLMCVENVYIPEKKQKRMSMQE